MPEQGQLAIPAAKVGGTPDDRLRLFTILAVLYVGQAIPAYLVVGAALPIMREQGASRSAIGLVGLLLLPGLLRFLWAPAVDRIRPFARAHRAGWIGLTQIGIIAGLVALSFVPPVEIGPFLAIGFMLGLLLSTNDIAVDGYATTSLAAADRPIGNAIQGGAVAVGVIVGTTGGLVLYARFGWQATALTIAALSVLPLAAAFAMRETTGAETARPAPHAALAAFFRRPQARRMLAVALIYRASEGLIGAMEGPYLVDRGVSLDVIGYLTGAAAATAGLAGSAIAALLLIRIGHGSTLALLGVLRTVCFAWFACHAFDLATGQSLLFGAAIGQTLIRYMEIVALFSLFMGTASKEQPGTDFTVLSCAQVLVFLLGSLLAGVLADWFGYGVVFALATALSLLSVAITARLLSGGAKADLCRS